MAWIGRRHAALARIAPAVSLEALVQGPVARLAEEALAAVPPGRQRALTPNVVLSLVLGMAMWRDKSVPQVLNHVLAPWQIRDPVTDGALAHARVRLGSEPLKRFFESVAAAREPEATFHGRRVRAMDGVRMTVPDTARNARAYARPHHEGPGRPRPQILVVMLDDVATHRIRAASIHPCRTGERDPGLGLLAALSAGDLVLIDRGFYSALMVRELEKMGLEYVVRLPASVRPRVTRVLGPGDFEVEIATHYRRERPRRGNRRRWESASQEISVRARMIEYRIDGARGVVRLLTNVRDVPASEIAGLYHWRWEIELGFDEIKTHLASARHGSQDTPVRSRSPDLVEQEVWALLAAYDLIRDAMGDAAGRIRADPRSLSFVQCVDVMRSSVSRGRHCSARSRRRLRREILEDLAACRMRRWRRPRQCPRVVRARWNPFPGKKRWQGETRRNYCVELGRRVTA